MPARRHLLAAIIVLLPTVAAIVVLALSNPLETRAWLPALLAAAIVALLLVRPYLGAIGRFARFVEALAADREPGQPRFSALPAIAELAGSASTLTTGWRRHREAIANLAASAQAIVDGLPDPLIAVDRQRRIVRANRAAVRLLGTTPFERDLSAWLRHPDLLDATDAVLAADSEPDRTATADLQLAGPPALDLVAHVQGLPRAAADGSLALIVLHDVTAQRRAERMRADFVANASHELKTPLASLLGFIETLRGPARDDAQAQARFLGIMAEQAERMRRLVGDLLTLSQIEQREHSRPHGTVDLPSVLRGVRDMLDLRARDRRVTLALALPPDLPPVEGDRDELTTVFQNLIDNAVKYTRPGTEVRIAAAADTANGLVRVSVADQGEGIAEHHIPRLTERFYRVDRARSRDLGGTGLGLAIVKHLVNRHRGRLEIDSRVGDGSTFTVVLPARTGEFS